MPYHLPLEPRPSGSPLPLSAAQWLYWHLILRQNTRGSPFRNIVASLRLSGSLDVSQLERNLETIAARHESLRTRIVHFDAEQEPTQIVDPPYRLRLDPIDVSRTRDGGGEQAARELGRDFLSEQIDLREGPLFATRLIKLSTYEHVLVLALDHIVSDATSYPILTRELISLFKRDSTSARDLLPTIRIQFPDYVLWQHKTAETWRREHDTYWHAKLSQYRRIQVPTDYPSSFQGPVAPSDAMHVPLGTRLTAQLREISRQERSLIPYTLLSLYLVIMSRWCERSDLLVNFISHGRHSHCELRDMIGCLAHPVFLRIDLSPKDRLVDILHRVTIELQCSLARDPSRVLAIADELTEISFNWLPTDWGVNGTYPSAAFSSENQEAGLRIGHFPVGKWIFQKFAPVFTDTPSGILAVIWYDKRLFLRTTLEQFGTQLRRLSEIFIQNPNTELANLDFHT